MEMITNIGNENNAVDRELRFRKLEYRQDLEDRAPACDRAISKTTSMSRDISVYVQGYLQDPFYV